MSMATSDPAATLAWLNSPRLTPTKRFHDLGPVSYTRFMQSSKTHKRLAYMVDAACEIEGCTSIEPSLVFDHCHHHGWIRAVLCNAHNVRIAHLEAGWREYGIDLSATPYWPVLMACVDCISKGDDR